MTTNATMANTATRFEIETISERALDHARRTGLDISGNPIAYVTMAGGEPLRCCLRDAEPGEAAILQQNIDRQAGHGESGTRSRALQSGSLTAALDLAGWRRMVRKVARMVREMPSGACRTIGAEQLNFVYDNCGVVVIQFLAGIACCFRKT